MKRFTKRTDNGIMVGNIEYNEPKELVKALERLAYYEDTDLTPGEFKESSNSTLELNKRPRPFFDKFSKGCEYQIEIPHTGTCCNAYLQSYPLCEGKNCPKLYPFLNLNDVND